jgi:hypothetical protein
LVIPHLAVQHEVAAEQKALQKLAAFISAGLKGVSDGEQPKKQRHKKQRQAPLNGQLLC